LGLDKWIKPEDTKKQKIKKKDEGDQSKDRTSKPKEEQEDKKSSKLTKFGLTCPKAKCKYKKTIVKKTLTEKDKICPRCKSEMKLN